MRSVNLASLMRSIDFASHTRSELAILHEVISYANCVVRAESHYLDKNALCLKQKGTAVVYAVLLVLRLSLDFVKLSRANRASRGCRLRSDRFPNLVQRYLLNVIEERRGEARRGEERRGEASRGEARRGQERRGEARLVRSGQARQDAERELARVNFSTR
ncbi:hypothetical protein ACLB2K_004191 [Fragaria x ananassa]